MEGGSPEGGGEWVEEKEEWEEEGWKRSDGGG